MWKNGTSQFRWLGEAANSGGHIFAQHMVLTKQEMWKMVETLSMSIFKDKKMASKTETQSSWEKRHILETRILEKVDVAILQLASTKSDINLSVRQAVGVNEEIRIFIKLL
ncbi:unnamed protein product, partial [Mesorhabditis spiculigera]